MSSVSDIVADGASTTGIDVYDVFSVSDVATDGISSIDVGVYELSGVLDVGVDGVSCAYVDVAERQAGGGVSLPWYVWVFIALFVIDVLASRRGRRRR